MTWKISKHVKSYPKLRNPVLLEGLPGIGNVGKVAVDFIIEELKAKKIMSLSSYTMPHSVFVNEDNLVELPRIEIYFKKMKGKRDLLLLAGDIQPIDEQSSYEFSDRILDIVQDFKGHEIVTLGGIGLPSVTRKPKVYCTGNDKNLVKKYKNGTGVNDKLYGVVGPIIGVSGLLLGLAQKRKIPAVSLLAETLGHPMYLGIKGAKEILLVLNKQLDLKLNIKNLEKDIKEIEEGMLKKTEELQRISSKASRGKGGRKEVSYIG